MASWIEREMKKAGMMEPPHAPYMMQSGENGKASPAHYSDLGRDYSLNDAYFPAPGTIPASAISPIFPDTITLQSIQQGSMLFAGVGGKITQNNANNFWDNTNLLQKYGTGVKIYMGVTGSLNTDAGSDYLAIKDSVNGGIRQVIQNTNTGQFAYSLVGCASDEANEVNLRINNSTLSVAGLYNTPGAGVLYLGQLTGSAAGHRSLIVTNSFADSSSHLIFGTQNTERARFDAASGALLINATARVGSELLRVNGGVYIDTSLTLGANPFTITGSITVTGTLESQVRLLGGNTSHTLSSPSGQLYLCQNTNVQFFMDTRDQAADSKLWDFLTSGTTMNFRVVNDANSVGTAYMDVSRTGTTVNYVRFANSPVRISNLSQGNIVFPDANSALTGSSSLFWDSTNLFQNITNTVGKQLRLSYDGTHFVDFKLNTAAAGFNQTFTITPKTAAFPNAFCTWHIQGSDFCFSYEGDEVNGLGVPNLTIRGPASSGYAASSGPGLNLYNNLSAVDNKGWSFNLNDNIYSCYLFNDANNSVTAWMTVTRSGMSVTGIDFLASVGLNTASPGTYLDIKSTASGVDHYRMTGIDYFGDPTMTSGVAHVLYVNVSGNRQYCIGDTALLASNGTNPFFRFQINSKILDCVSTNATRLAFTLGGAGQLVLAADGTSLNLVASGGKLGYFGGTAVVQQTAAGNTAYSDSGATVVHSAGTFTGGVGATGYTIGDIVAALKQYNMLVA